MRNHCKTCPCNLCLLLSTAKSPHLLNLPSRFALFVDRDNRTQGLQTFGKCPTNQTTLFLYRTSSLSIECDISHATFKICPNISSQIKLKDTVIPCLPMSFSVATLLLARIFFTSPPPPLSQPSRICSFTVSHHLFPCGTIRTAARFPMPAHRY